MVRSNCVVLSFLLCLALTGCASGQSILEPVSKVLAAPFELIFGKKEVATKPPALIEPSDAYRLGFSPRWATDIAVPDGHRLTSVTILDDIIVCVERPGNMVTALEVRDGSLRWQKVVGSPLDVLFEPVRHGPDEVLINSETELITLAADKGLIMRRSNLESAVKDRPVMLEDLAIFGGLNGNLFAHHVTAGYSFWQYKMTSGITVRPVLAGIQVFVTDSRGVYALVQANTGEVLWKGRTYATNTATPSITNIGVFLASEDQTLYALNRLTSDDMWKHRADAPLTAGPIVIENMLFQEEPNAGMVALDALSGEVLWRYDLAARPISIVGNKLLLDEKYRITVLDAPSGKLIGHAPVQPLKAIVNGPGGSLILVTEQGRLLRIDPKV